MKRKNWCFGFNEAGCTSVKDITVLSVLNQLTHLKSPVGTSMGFTQIVARGD
jgi:hypothetical protein